VRGGFKVNMYNFRKCQKYPGVQGHFLGEMAGGDRVTLGSFQFTTNGE